MLQQTENPSAAKCNACRRRLPTQSIQLCHFPSWGIPFLSRAHGHGSLLLVLCMGVFVCCCDRAQNAMIPRVEMHVICADNSSSYRSARAHSDVGGAAGMCKCMPAQATLHILPQVRTDISSRMIFHREICALKLCVCAGKQVCGMHLCPEGEYINAV